MGFCRIIRNISFIIFSFFSAFAFGQVFYRYLLKEIPFPGNSGCTICLILSTFLGLCNVLFKKFRCIYLLKFPMYCGKPGRGVLKAIILTYIVTGPIRNMGLNAKEVVRVFACSTQLAHNLSREKYGLRLGPVTAATSGVSDQARELKDAFRLMEDVIQPIELEIQDTNETKHTIYENNLMDDFFGHKRRTYDIEAKLPSSGNSSDSVNYELQYQKKLRHRCENQISRASFVCIQRFRKAYTDCCKLMPRQADKVICWSLAKKNVCDLMTELSKRSKDKEVCAAPTNPGLRQKFDALKEIRAEFVDKLHDVNVEPKKKGEANILDFQNAKETAERVQQAFEEKTIVMHHVFTIMNICTALLFLRIFGAAVKYHDLYLTSIDYDNVYITDYFKRIDAKRKISNKYTLLPLKKMEHFKYIDIYSLSYMESQRSNLGLHILKVMLEVVTATTFVMLDRLFYEALEVVRQHAEADVQQQATRDLDIQVEGTGMLAAMLRVYLSELNAGHPNHQATNSACLPHPRQMPYIYFLKIYGGYTWIVILLFANPYTMRLKRLICSHFYPCREKERILHLYNDILKKRMKLPKTLRRKAVQAVRAHYLSRDVLSLLSVRMRFPQVLGWLRALPAARMTCLICGDMEPRTDAQSGPHGTWHTCLVNNCPFVYCPECWREIGARCLACEPSLAELSDVDSLTDDEPHKY